MKTTIIFEEGRKSWRDLGKMSRSRNEIGMPDGTAADMKILRIKSFLGSHLSLMDEGKI